MLKEFTSLVNFKKLSLDDALRLYLGYFSLPGESQQIERFVAAFSYEWCYQNPGHLCEDSVYLLVYSLIMLQTDAHNYNVETKMDLEEFRKLARNIKVNRRDPLPEEFVDRLYFSVTGNPLAVHHTIKRRAELDSIPANSTQDCEILSKTFKLQIRSAEMTCKMRFEDQFVVIDDGPAVGLAFEELIVQTLLLPLKNLIRTEMNLDPRINGLAINSFLQFFNLASACPHKHQVVIRLRLEYQDMTGMNSDSPLDNLFSLSKAKVIMIITSIKFFNEYFLQLSSGWKLFFDTCYKLMQLHQFRLNKNEYPEEHLTTQTIGLLNRLFESLTMSEIEGCFSLYKLLNKPHDLVQIASELLDLASKEVCDTCSPKLFFLQQAHQVVSNNPDKMVTPSCEFFKHLADFVNETVDYWPPQIKTEIMKVIMDITVQLLVVVSCQ